MFYPLCSVIRGRPMAVPTMFYFSLFGYPRTAKGHPYNVLSSLFGYPRTAKGRPYNVLSPLFGYLRTANGRPYKFKYVMTSQAVPQ